MSGTSAGDPLDAWIDALVERHTRDFSRPEFLKSVRALSTRYVERRSELPSRSVLDSAGKRAAFAGFYAPLHLITVRALVRELALPLPASLADLGCGTGVASAGWALAARGRTELVGIDESHWALQEASWNWRHLGLRGRTRRGHLGQAATHLRTQERARLGIVLGWAANELHPEVRSRLLDDLTALVARGAPLLIVEPIARTHAPWWPLWVEAFGPLGARTLDWKAAVAVPARLAQLDREAGFRRDALSARVLWCAGRPGHAMDQTRPVRR